MYTRAGFLAIAACFSLAATATLPTLYHSRGLQSPTQAAPDDLLLLAGNGLAPGDRVAYQVLGDATELPSPPLKFPAEATATAGEAVVVSTANLPYSLAVRLPPTMAADAAYAVWVRNAAGEWSNGVTLNEVQPLWFSPSQLPAVGRPVGLPRELKIIGRNLGSQGSVATSVRLTGPQSSIFPALATAPTGASGEQFAIRVALPDRLLPGRYRLSVSRGNQPWSDVVGQELVITALPAAVPEFRVDDPEYGGCRGDDQLDDTACVVAAIAAAARNATGGTVRLGSGIWRLGAGTAHGVKEGEGIVLPTGVNLVGDGPAGTTLERLPNWNSGSTNATFTLTGSNVVSGICFRDLHHYGPKDAVGPMLQLGKAFYRADPANDADPKLVADVVITGNSFEHTHPAIIDGGLPIARLIVTHNEFGAYATAIQLSGNRKNLRYPFRIDDSIIAHNRFEPGSYLDTSIGQGAMATSIGATRRLDFSDNVADGTSRKYLYADSDAGGWRAAFFWHLSGNQEMLLVSGNTATCTGDKAGDGEAIAFDGSANAFAFLSARDVTGATQTSVTVTGVLRVEQSGERVPDPSYYVGHWIHIGQGSGLGQVRRVVGVHAESKSESVTFDVLPAFDVVPQVGGRVDVGRIYWQVYAVGNRVDQRAPLCRKSNRTAAKGGGIVLWAPIADSVVADNRQYDTDGITLQHSYSVPDRGCPDCESANTFQSFVEIRGNLIEGEYAWDSNCSHSGILLASGASPTPSSPPPVLGYGTRIAHNRMDGADALGGGAIAAALTWHAGPPPHRWAMIATPLLYHNDIRYLAGPPPRRLCAGDTPARSGINLSSAALIDAPVLYGNSCMSVDRPLVDPAARAVAVCPSPLVGNSCECPPLDLTHRQ